MEFKLRPFEIDDLQSLVKHANNEKIAQFMTNQFPHPYTTETGKAFIELCMSHNPTRIFTFDINGEASGGIGIHPQADIMCKNAELGYWLAEPFWNNGIVSKAVIQALDYGFKTFDINRIYARPFSNNLASQKVLEKCGFKLEARIEKNIFKNGDYLDELIYAVRRG